MRHKLYLVIKDTMNSQLVVLSLVIIGGPGRVASDHLILITIAYLYITSSHYKTFYSLDGAISEAIIENTL